MTQNTPSPSDRPSPSNPPAPNPPAADQPGQDRPVPYRSVPQQPAPYQPAPYQPTPERSGSQAAAGTAGVGLRRSGGWLFWIGLALSLAAAVFAIVAFANLARVPADAFRTAQPVSSPSATVQLESGDVRLLVWEGGTPDSCTATSPSGQDVLITDSSTSYGPRTMPGSGYPQTDDYDNGGLLTAPETGAYTVECTGTTALLLDFGDLGSAVNWGLGIAIALVVGSFTSLLVVLGGVLWLVGRSQQINR
jgi:hypothetical protein